MLETLRRTLELLTRRERWLLILLLIVSTIGAFSEVFGIFSILPFLAAAGNPDIIHSNAILHRIYTTFEFTSSRSFLISCGVLTIAALAINNVIGCFTLWFRTRVCYRIVQGLSERLFRGYLGQEYTYFLNKNTSILLKNLMGETQQLANGLLDPVSTLFGKVLAIVFVAAALAIHDWQVASVVILGFGALYGGIYALTRKRLAHLGDIRWASNEQASKLVMEGLSGIKDVKLSGFEGWFYTRFSILMQQLVVAQRRSALYGSIPRFLIETLAFSAIVGVVLVVLLRNGELTAILPTLGLYALAGYRMMPAMNQIYGCISMLRFSEFTVKRLWEAIHEAHAGSKPISESPDTRKLKLQAAVRFEDLRFTYPRSDRPVLNGVTFTIEANSCVGFVGASGAGKSTLMDVTLGLLHPESGRITVDGIVLTEENIRHWQNSLGYVAQQIYLADASIAENIGFGIPKDILDHNRVEKAARLASLHEFISTQLPDGYKTIVGERGARLSGGQRQRIGIARALYNDPEILFFDEATSALDNETEEAIVESIQSIAHRKTVIMIAHRITSLRNCDAIFVLEAGRIARKCTYAELLASDVPEIHQPLGE